MAASTGYSLCTHIASTYDEGGGVGAHVVEQEGAGVEEDEEGRHRLEVGLSWRLVWS